MKRAVIDASVILKWYLLDEVHGENALALLYEYVAGRLEILAPSLATYEVMNGLVIAGRRARFEEDAIATSIDSFMSLGIRFYDVSLFADKLIYYSLRYDRSVYDASYLSLADQEGVDMITADQRLYNSVKKDLPWVHWVGGVEK